MDWGSSESTRKHKVDMPFNPHQRSFGVLVGIASRAPVTFSINSCAPWERERHLGENEKMKPCNYKLSRKR